MSGSGTGSPAAAGTPSTELTTLQENLDFLGISYLSFTITSANDVLRLKYDSGSVTNVDIPDGTYEGDGLATAMKTAIDSALSCTSTVTWSSSTYKFTIAVSASHTIAYTHASSDMGLTVGFDADHAAALSITSDNAVSDPTSIVSTIKSSVEAMVQTYCKRTLKSTSYSERYDGDGSTSLVLRQYPVTAISRFALWPIDVIRVANTNTSTNATVSVSSTGVTVTKDGTSNTLAFATYTTFTLLVDAINALGSGWSAALQSSSYASYTSTSLIEKMGMYCLNTTWAYLQMPYDRGESYFDIDSASGIIYLNSFRNFDGNWKKNGFPIGTRNIFIDYTAGYSTIPDDLKLAVKIIVKWIYQKRSDESFGVTNFGSGGISVSFENNIPWEAKMILDTKYVRRMVSSL